MQLKRNISKSSLLFLSIGSIVGSGWLFGSFYTAQIAGPAAILSWMLGGLCVFIIALSFAELSTMFPFSGGSIVYSLLSHGKLTGSMFSWITWLWTMVLVPIEVQAVIQYSSTIFPDLMHKTSDGQSLTTAGYITATILMGALSAINVVGVKLMAETNKFVVIWKLVIPISVGLLLIGVNPHTQNFTSKGFAPNGFEGILSSIAIGGVSFSFFGFQTAIFLAGEAKNPQKSIPFALFGSIAGSLLLYLILQIGFILSVDPSSIENGWSNIMFSNDAGPFAAIFISLGLLFMVNILYFDAVISPLGTAVGYVAASSRILYSMSLQNDAPKTLSSLNRFSIPWKTIIINFIFGMLFFLPFSGWQSMVAFLSAAVVVTLACGPICLPIFRKKFPNIPRPFNLPFHQFFCFLAFYICNLLLQWTGWDIVWKLELAVIIGLIIFFISKLVNKNNEKIYFKSFSWFALYLIISGVLSYLSSYKGIGVLTPVSDFIVIFLTSLIIFIYAQKTAISDEDSQDLFDKLLSKHYENLNSAKN